MRLLAIARATPAAALLPLLLGCGGSGADEPLLSVVAATNAGFQEELAPRPGDRAVFVNFWAKWCGPCMSEMPEIVELAHDWRDEGVRVVAVNIDIATAGMVPDPLRTPDEVRGFAELVGIDLPIVAFQGDWDALVDELDLPGPVPYTFVLNARGEVVDTQLGAAGTERFEEMLAKALD